MSVILLAAVFLCGTPVGFVLGLLVAWRVFRPAASDDPDYSGGA